VQQDYDVMAHLYDEFQADDITWKKGMGMTWRPKGRRVPSSNVSFEWRKILLGSAVRLIGRLADRNYELLL